MIIRDRDGIYSVGSPGVTVAMPRQTVGDLTPVLANPDDYVAALNVDLPFLVPLENGRFDVVLSDRAVELHHEMRERGSEQFSTLDTTQLPYFSRFQIQMRPFADYPDGPSLGSERIFSQRFKSYRIIIEILEKLDEFLRINSKQRKLLEGLPPRLSYKIGYFRRGEPPVQVAESVYLTSDPVEIQGPESLRDVDNNALRAYLSQSVRIAAFAKQSIEPGFKDKTFREKAFLALHDFCYYCRQHARAVGQLEEEYIRDLFLVVVNCLFGAGEGEVFNYDGKLDYRIKNPANKYEAITGELKWWHGPASAADIYHQGVRKHATGQETEIHLVMLNRNKSVRTMADEYWSSIEAQPETQAGSRFDLAIPAGSRERFAGYFVEIRDESIPLVAAVADLYYERS